MSNKRKKLARSIAAKTGMSYQGAINQLNEGRCVISKQPFTLDDLFLVDNLLEGVAPLYAKDSGFAVLYEANSDHFQMAYYPRRIVAPLSELESSKLQALKASILEYLAWFAPKTLTPDQIMPYVRGYFVSDPGPIRLVRVKGSYMCENLHQLSTGSEPGLQLAEPNPAYVGYESYVLAIREKAGIVPQRGNLAGLFVMSDWVCVFKVK